jgi:penicillin-binding protein
MNDGNILVPHLILNSGTEIWKENAFSPETAEILRDDLIQVIESGSITDAQVSGRILGGKTGTAEIKQSQDDETGTELGWFVLFTADEHEENPLIILSMVEDVKGRGGSHYVSSKVKALFE